jgi:DNA-binding response OmpR family regulator
MKILLADDETFSRNVLRKTLIKWGYDVVEASDGIQALHILESDDGPRLALLDWIMPEMDGIAVVREIRESFSRRDRYVYIVLLTQKDSMEDLVAGLDAGADDYVMKPFDGAELKTRLRSGRRIVELQIALEAANSDLRHALAQVKKLGGCLPICASCKRIRDDNGSWRQIESYISDHSEARFSHGICPECARKVLGDCRQEK